MKINIEFESLEELKLFVAHVDVRSEDASAQIPQAPVAVDQQPQQTTATVMPATVPAAFQQLVAPQPATAVPQAVQTPPQPVTAVPQAVQTPPQPATAVPQAAPSMTTPAEYTMDDLSLAGASLMRMGKQDALLALLQEFCVNSIVALDKSQYGAFATRLRGLGAQI